MPIPKQALPTLGDLEQSVLEHLWEAGESDVVEAHRAIGKRRGITVNTVGSAIERLHRKGLTERDKVSHAYRYRAAVTREAFAARRMLDAVGVSRRLTDAGLLSAFIDLVADEDEASLDRLEALIARKREQGDKR